jgi:hypothetical protein
MAGNRSGPRGWYRYVDDIGNVWAIFTDVDLAEAGGLTPALIGTNEKPQRLQPRYLVAKSVAAPATNRRIVCLANFDLYENGGVINIDSEAFRVTGRVGEQYTFPQLAVPGP